MVLSCFVSLNSGVCVLEFSSKSAMGHLHTLSTFGSSSYGCSDVESFAGYS